MDEEKLNELLDFLRMFDTDGNDVVDVSELSAGISASAADLATTKFEQPSFSSMRTAMATFPWARLSTFTLCSRCFIITWYAGCHAGFSHGACHDYGQAVLRDADKNQDGHISFAEFKEWYSRPTSSAYAEG